MCGIYTRPALLETFLTPGMPAVVYGRGKAGPSAPLITAEPGAAISNTMITAKTKQNR